MTDDELSQLKQKYEAARAEAWVVVEAYLNHCNGGTDLRALRRAVAKTDAARAAYVEAEAAHKADVSAPATLATEKATPPAS